MTASTKTTSAQSDSESNVNAGQSASASDDLRYMGAAIRYARRHVGITGTNPSVACLIVAYDGGSSWIAGRGVTQVGGRPHAEPVALEQAGKDARGACAYVTLEPCAHHGVTLPCASTLIESGVARVVTAQRDPDNRVNSKGLKMLRDAGIEVIENVAHEEAAWGIRGYLSRKSRSRPWVILKLALTSDGYLGQTGAGQVAITGAVTNARTHLMRARSDAILIGSATAINDDPSLTCRLLGIEERSPVRIVVENNNPVKRNSNFIELAAKIETYIACPQDNLAGRKAELAGTSSKFIACDTKQGNVALPELMTDLSDIGIASLMVEGGGKIARAFIEDQLVDEIILYVGKEKMSDKPQANARSSWVSSPILVDAVPEGFHITGKWRYGTDKVVRMVADRFSGGFDW